jgi:hypothetical protein
MYEPILELAEELPIELAKELPIEVAEEIVSPELTALYERYNKLRELKKVVKVILRDCLEDMAAYEKEMTEIAASAEELL